MITENLPENKPEIKTELPVRAVAVPGGNDSVSELGWIASSFILPAASLSFYRRAVQRGSSKAVLFFVIFMGLITLLSTIGISIKMSQVSDDIRLAFDSGRVPEITITNGVAAVKGKQTAVLVDKDNMLVAVDTTGTMKDIDATRYSSGFLLTAREIVVLSSSGQSQRMTLSQIQQIFNQNPLVINGETTARFWQSFTAGISLLVFLGLAFWNLAVRFVYLALMALLVRTVMALLGAKIPYGLVFTIGVYALVPAVYLTYVVDRLGSGFIFLQTLLLLVTWSIGLYAAQAKNGWDILGPDRSLRSWRALVGLPFLIVLAVDVLFSLRNGGWFCLFAGIITLITLIIAGWLSKPSLEDIGLPGYPPQPPEPPVSGSLTP